MVWSDTLMLALNSPFGRIALQSEGPVTRPPTSHLLRPRHLRTRWRSRRRLFLLTQGVEHAPAALPERSARRLLRGRAGVLDDRSGLAVQTRQDREHQAGGEKRSS